MAKRKGEINPSLPVPVEQMRLAHDVIVSRRNRKAQNPSKMSRKLAAWEYKFAEWYAQHLFTYPRKTRSHIESTVIATRARMYQTECRDPDWSVERVFGPKEWLSLKRRVDFQEYVSLLLSSMTNAAKKKFEDHSLDFVDGHLKGLKLAVDADDYRQIYRYTNPAIDRIVPTKQDHQITAVQIILSPSQQQTLDAPLPVVEVEVLD
jgi:hypothetical protein